MTLVCSSALVLLQTSVKHWTLVLTSGLKNSNKHPYNNSNLTQNSTGIMSEDKLLDFTINPNARCDSFTQKT